MALAKDVQLMFVLARWKKKKVVFILLFQTVNFISIPIRRLKLFIILNISSPYQIIY